MSYVNVIVVAPDGQEYDAEVDTEADDQTLISDLVRNLDLPKREEDGRTAISYAVNLIGASRIREGVTLQLYKIPRSAVRLVRPRK